MKMIRILIVMVTALVMQSAIAQHKAGALIGVVSDLENMETIPFANIVVKSKDGEIIAGGASDFDGKFNINPIAPGQYTIEASFTGYETEVFKQVKIQDGEQTRLDILLIEGSYELVECVITCGLPAIEKTICSMVVTSCCWTTCCFSESSLDQSDFQNQDFKLYPNPSSGELNLKTEDKIDRLFITDMNGQTVAEIDAENSNDISADLRHLPAATYVVHYSEGRSRESQLWILQH